MHFQFFHITNKSLILLKNRFLLIKSSDEEGRMTLIALEVGQTKVKR